MPVLIYSLTYYNMAYKHLQPIHNPFTHSPVFLANSSSPPVDAEALEFFEDASAPTGVVEVLEDTSAPPGSSGWIGGGGCGCGSSTLTGGLV